MERKLAAIFSTDVKGYSRLMGDDEEATIHTLKTYRDVITNLIEQHHGRVVDSPGDNMLAEFASAVDAVKSAVAIQQELKARNAELDEHRKMEFRIGLNVGDVITDEGRLYGDGVNIAARLESLADPGGICLSANVHEQVRNKLSLQYEYIGEREVKNIATPVPVYKVRLDAEGTAPSVSRKQPAVSPIQATRSRWPMAALGVVAVLVTVAMAAVRYGFFLIPSTQPLTPSPQSLPLPDKPSIAVLPFTNMSGDPEQEYFSDGMTDTLITDLSRVSGLFVIARNSAFAYKGQAVDIAEVSRKLGVRYVLEGSVQKAGGRLRVNTQLVDATSGGHVWADRYDRKLEDLFALQDELTQQIVSALEVKLTAGEQASLYRRTTTNLAAYDLFLRAMTYTMRYTEEGNAQGRQLFERALELDPTYVDAYAMLGWSYFHEWVLQWSHDPEVLEQAFALARQGIALDASVAEPHLLLGFVYLWRDRQHEQAIAEGKQALALAPNYSWAYANLAEMLLYVGRHEEAIQLMEQAMRLDPRYPAPYPLLLGSGYRGLEQYAEAEAAYKKALVINPDFWPAHSNLAILYSELGRVEEAQAEAAEVLRLNPKFSLEIYKQRVPIKDPAMLERHIAALRKAGLK